MRTTHRAALRLVRHRRQLHALRHLAGRDEDCPCDFPTYQGFARGWPTTRPPTAPRPLPLLPGPVVLGVEVDVDGILAVCRFRPENLRSLRSILAHSINVALEEADWKLSADDEGLEKLAVAVDAELLKLRGMGLVFRREGPPVPPTEPEEPNLDDVLAQGFLSRLSAGISPWECVPGAEPAVRAALEAAVVEELQRVGEPTGENMGQLVGAVNATLQRLQSEGLVRLRQ